MADDVSKTTVAVLLVVVIVLSIAGTWIAMNASSSPGSDVVQGKVSVYVKPRPVVESSEVTVDVVNPGSS